MKVLLMHPDRDVDLERELPSPEEAVTRDLELETLLSAMAGDDQFLREVARRTLLLSLTEPAEITYRQAVLADCIDHPDVIRAMYDIAVQAITGERRVFVGLFRDSPESILFRSRQVLELFVAQLTKLRQVADSSATGFCSPGFTRFFGMLAAELDDAYLGEIAGCLRELSFTRGVLISARLGRGNKGVDHVLRRPRTRRWRDKVPGVGRTGYGFEVPERDESGCRALSDLRSRGLARVADATARAVDHILGFFTTLRTELAFYVACLNLRQRLAESEAPICFPEAMPADADAFTARGLYDVCLALTVGDRVVGNDVAADGKRLVMITGANRGGKSTFLRSVGLAYLMMQCGMFVPAVRLRASVCAGVFTHFTRPEDAGMRRGRLDEELDRMSAIADRMTRGCVLLCNESFSSTNEREGSEIARQVVRALVESEVRVFFVTHLFDLAHDCYRERSNRTLFLRAERRSDGTRTFRVSPGEPLPTSYGEDLYRRIVDGHMAGPLQG